MTPHTKFEKIFCHPKPRPTPKAPVNTAKAVRSIPTAERAIKNAAVIKLLLRQPSTVYRGMVLLTMKLLLGSGLKIDALSVRAADQPCVLNSAGKVLVKRSSNPC